MQSNQTLIICPLKKEAQLIIQHLQQLDCEVAKENRGIGNLWSIHQMAAHLVIAGAGKIKFTEKAQPWLKEINSIQQIVVTGAAGALSSEASIGDVFAVAKIIEVDSSSGSSQRAVWVSDSDFFRKTQYKEFAFHRGPVASVEAPINLTSRRDQIQQKTGALAVTQESAAGASLAQSANLSYYEIRGITDRASENAVTEFNENLEKTMKNVAQVLYSNLAQNS